MVYCENIIMRVVLKTWQNTVLVDIMAKLYSIYSVLVKLEISSRHPSRQTWDVRASERLTRQSTGPNHHRPVGPFHIFKHHRPPYLPSRCSRRVHPQLTTRLIARRSRRQGLLYAESEVSPVACWQSVDAFTAHPRPAPSSACHPTIRAFLL